MVQRSVVSAMFRIIELRTSRKRFACSSADVVLKRALPACRVANGFCSVMGFLKSILRLFPPGQHRSRKNYQRCTCYTFLFSIRLHEETGFYAAHQFLTMALKLTSALHNKSVSTLLFGLEAFWFFVMFMQPGNVNKNNNNNKKKHYFNWKVITVDTRSINSYVLQYSTYLPS